MASHRGGTASGGAVSVDCGRNIFQFTNPVGMVAVRAVVQGGKDPDSAFEIFEKEKK